MGKTLRISHEKEGPPVLHHRRPSLLIQQLRFGLGFEIYLEIVGWNFLEGGLGEKWPRIH